LSVGAADDLESILQNHTAENQRQSERTLDRNRDNDAQNNGVSQRVEAGTVEQVCVDICAIFDAAT
jgi:hypothetical protein